MSRARTPSELAKSSDRVCRAAVRRPAWQGSAVTEETRSAPTSGDLAESAAEPAEWLSPADVADRLDIPVTRVHQLIRDLQLLAVKRESGVRIPADMIDIDPDGRPAGVKHLHGVLTLLHDAGFSDEESLRWLYTPDDTLPGTPMQALRGNRGTEIKRRAQAAGF